MLESESQQAWIDSNRWDTNTVSIFQEENKKVRIVVSFCCSIYIAFYPREIHTHIHMYTLLSQLSLLLNIVRIFLVHYVFAQCEKHRVFWAYVWWRRRCDTTARCLSRCFLFSQNIVFVSHILRMLSSKIFIVFSVFDFACLPACASFLFLICMPFTSLRSVVSLFFTAMQIYV